MAVCFRRSGLLAMNFLVQAVTMSFTMAAAPQAAREEETPFLVFNGGLVFPVGLCPCG